MSKASNHDPPSSGRRKSLNLLPALGVSKSHDDGASKPAKSSKKALRRRPPSLLTDLNHPDVAHANDDVRSSTSPALSDAPRLKRPSLSLRNSTTKRPTHSQGKSSWQSSSDEYFGDAAGIGEPLSATPSSATSTGFGERSMTPVRTVVLHGEVQTSAGVFRKKKEYLVLTDTHLLRFKSQIKAADAFSSVPYPSGRAQASKQQHGAMPSVGSFSDLQTLSDSSGDKNGRIVLRQVVAVYRLDDGKPYFAVDVCYLDEDTGQSSSLSLQFGNPEERDVWMKNIRAASNEVRLQQRASISASNVENAARIVERDRDYDPENCAIYKIVQRQQTSKSSRTSTSVDDLTKVASTNCFLAIGVHKVHIIQLVKGAGRSSSSSLVPNHSQAAFGILNLTSIRVNEFDDTFDLTFRQPFQQPKQIHLASLWSHEIAARLHFTENFLRPECGHRLYKFNVPMEVEHNLLRPVESDEEHSCLDRTLAAYCIAYGLNPTNVRYAIDYDCEDAPRFNLLSPSDSRRPEYGPLALLAIMRALRYNESFGSLSFAGVSLDSLNGLHDEHGKEYVCSRTKRGTPIKLPGDQLERSSLLVQEVRALAATSKKLRRMDFSGCVSVKVAATAATADDENARAKDTGCGIIEALVPLCRHQTTNVDWVCLNGIKLSDMDMDYLVGAAVDKSCHFRAIELNRCGLNDRSMGLILDALRAQENTLEAIEIAGNTARLDPLTFDSQLGMFGFIRKLNLSYVSRNSGNEPLLTAETLLIWRLQELRLSGTALNAASVDAVATYLAHPQSTTLHELYFDNAFLSGHDIATLLHSLAFEPDHVRDLHLDISQSMLSKGLEKVTKAIADGLTPSHLSMRAIEYREESLFRKMLTALTMNKTIRYLDMSQTALPGDASDDTCRALSKLLAENDTLLELDLSGEDSRLASSKFGSGVNEALMGLKQNTSIQTFRIEKQKLGIQGASTLADVLKENSSLRELHCANNEIPLQGLTDLVNSLIDNTTLVYLPRMQDGREAAFKSAEATMKGMSDADSPNSATVSRNASLSSSAASRPQRGFSSVRRKAARAASAYTPSFPALPSVSRNNSSEGSSNNNNNNNNKPSTSPLHRPSSPFTLTLPASKTKQTAHHGPVAAAPVPFTVQDIQTTHRLLNEQWDRQCHRLTQYLDRNWRLLSPTTTDATTTVEVEDEKSERPHSLGRVLELVKSETTPRLERDAYFDDAPSSSLTFRQFLETEEAAAPDLGALNLGEFSWGEEPAPVSTPRQGVFTA